MESLRLRIVDQQLRSFYSPIVTGYYDLYIDILMRQPNEDQEACSARRRLKPVNAAARGSLLELLSEAE